MEWMYRFCEFTSVGISSEPRCRHETRTHSSVLKNMTDAACETTENTRLSTNY